MIQFTTPDTTLVLPNVVFDGTEKPWVTITQGTGAGATEIEVDDLDVTTEGTDTVIQFTLTQEQTGALSVGRANLQLNWLTSDGKRRAYDITTINVTRNLTGEVRSYDGGEL